ncbi:MAG: TPM domain-containing protein [Burkholderiales bacterium]
MKRGDGVFLDAEAETAVKQRVAGLERSTGVEVVAAVIARADSYPEIPWKAFALGVSLALLAAAAAALVAPGWEAAGAIIETAVAGLATGAAAALATVWVEPIARLFLPAARRQAETLQYAQSMFLDAGLQRTPRRDGILLLVSLFEREVVVLADRGVRDRLRPAALDAVVGAVTAALKRGDVKGALLEGLARLEETLATAGFRAQPGEPDEVAQALIQQRGPS